MRRRVLAACAAGVLLASGCGGGRQAEPVTAVLARTAGAASSAHPDGSAGSEVARPVVALKARSTPAGPVTARISTSVRQDGGPTELLVLGARRVSGGQWLRVLLPTRPNGSSGWIPRAAVRLQHTGWAVVVSLAGRRLYALDRGRVVRSFAVVVGAAATPTPTGRFAITERIALGSHGGFYGSWMLTLTAHSRVLDTFAGGDGRIAIHGRGGASLATAVGTAASHGCVRMRNADIAWLAAHVIAGTPVIVVAGALH